MISNIIKQKHYTNQATNTLQQQKTIQQSKILALMSSIFKDTFRFFTLFQMLLQQVQCLQQKSKHICCTEKQLIVIVIINNNSNKMDTP